ncbi:MAG: hypothetical protein KF691_13525 [Phycisphaeraceae bacterium]|nr:hypothetical protein [Phycisphaeraceae bacterium]
METRKIAAILESLSEFARGSGLFGEVKVLSNRLVASAAASAAPAEYRVEVDGDSIDVGLFMKDRWLSHSIEADLLNTGDDLEELLEEELVEVGYSGPALTIDHYRNDEKMFAFRSRTGIKLTEQGAEEKVRKVLTAYEACFRPLGDMHQEGDDE